jgi:hypothetical protein
LSVDIKAIENPKNSRNIERGRPTSQNITMPHESQSNKATSHHKSTITHTKATYKE